MQKVLWVLLAVLAISAPAMAGGTVHVEVNANGEAHAVDGAVGDDGSVALVVDGEPVGAPALPVLP